MIQIASAHRCLPEAKINPPWRKILSLINFWKYFYIQSPGFNQKKYAWKEIILQKYKKKETKKIDAQKTHKTVLSDLRH